MILRTNLIAQFKSCRDVIWLLELRIPLEDCLYWLAKETLLMLVQIQLVLLPEQRTVKRKACGWLVNLTQASIDSRTCRAMHS